MVPLLAVGTTLVLLVWTEPVTAGSTLGSPDGSEGARLPGGATMTDKAIGDDAGVICAICSGPRKFTSRKHSRLEETNTLPRDAAVRTQLRLAMAQHNSARRKCIPAPTSLLFDAANQRGFSR